LEIFNLKNKKGVGTKKRGSPDFFITEEPPNTALPVIDAERQPNENVKP
jgi:hypothetical protein